MVFVSHGTMRCGEHKGKEVMAMYSPGGDIAIAPAGGEATAYTTWLLPRSNIVGHNGVRPNGLWKFMDMAIKEDMHDPLYSGKFTKQIL